MRPVCLPRVDATLAAFSAALVAHVSESPFRFGAHRVSGARFDVCVRHFIRVNIIYTQTRLRGPVAERAATRDRTERRGPGKNSTTRRILLFVREILHVYCM